MSEHSPAITEGLSRLIAKQAFFASILYESMKIVETTATETAATDGYHMYCNPDYFASLTPDERVFVNAHEILHNIYEHCPRSELYKSRGFGPDLLPYDDERMGKAMDYVINAVLKEAGVGSMPQGGLYDPAIADANDLVDDVYTRLPPAKKDPQGTQPPPPGGGQPGTQPGNGPPTNQPGHGGFDKHLPPPPNTPPRSKAETQRILTSAKAAAQAQGTLPGALSRLVDDIVDPKLDWVEVLRNEVTRCAGSESTTWAKPNRRKLCTAPGIYMPSRTGYQIGVTAVVLDTSGSITDYMISGFLGEVAGILEDCRPRECHVLFVDSEVARVPHDQVDDVSELRDLKPAGGGGTHMPAAFTYLDEQDIQPEQVVVFTDMYTGFGEEPDYPVIWCSTSKGIEAPYGTTIEVDID